MADTGRERGAIVTCHAFARNDLDRRSLDAQRR
jgi:hypothetical protein